MYEAGTDGVEATRGPRPGEGKHIARWVPDARRIRVGLFYSFSLYGTMLILVVCSKHKHDFLWSTAMVLIAAYLFRSVRSLLLWSTFEVTEEGLTFSRRSKPDRTLPWDQIKSVRYQIQAPCSILWIQARERFGVSLSGYDRRRRRELFSAIMARLGPDRTQIDFKKL